MKSQKAIEDKLDELENFCKKEHFTTEERHGEINALKYVLNKLGGSIELA